MRHLLFLAAMAAILCSIDAMFFQGKYRAAVWEDVASHGRAFSRDVDYQITKVFRSRF
jgi:hypothetical protein